METTEKIVEAYCRYVRGWFTIPNIKCCGQFEIDLLAVDPSNGDIKRYHVESGVSISGAYSKLTANVFSPDLLKQRTKIAGQRRTIGYFLDRKFGSPHIVEMLKKYGFVEGNYTKVVVTWGWTSAAKIAADSAGIQLWDFRHLMKHVANKCKYEKSHFTDDTLRTLQLFTRTDGFGVDESATCEDLLPKGM
jgi:hypothetical protein